MVLTKTDVDEMICLKGELHFKCPKCDKTHKQGRTGINSAHTERVADAEDLQKFSCSKCGYDGPPHVNIKVDDHRR